MTVIGTLAISPILFAVNITRTMLLTIRFIDTNLIVPQVT